jgi:hypothetical protein
VPSEKIGFPDGIHRCPGGNILVAKAKADRLAAANAPKEESPEAIPVKKEKKGKKERSEKQAEPEGKKAKTEKKTEQSQAQ